MPDNQLIFALGSTLSGLTAELRVRLLLPTGDVDALATPIAVTESAAVPGLYRATMAGAAGNYGAVLLRVVDSADVFVASMDSFRWDGNDFVEAATAPQIIAAQNAITAHTRPMAAQLGLLAGITATHGPTAITVSAGDGSTVITPNPDGTITVEGA